jgi:hypothetical protein
MKENARKEEGKNEGMGEWKNGRMEEWEKKRMDREKTGITEEQRNEKMEK